MIILDAYISYALFFIVGWWMFNFCIMLFSGCGGLDLKKLLSVGFIGSGCILVIFGVVMYITSST